MINKLTEFVNSWQSETAIIFGMILQFFFSPVKNVKIFLAILLSSIFIAIYLISPFIEIMEISNKSVRESMYAVSALISMEILSLIIIIVPKSVELFLRKKLGIENDSDK